MMPQVVARPWTVLKYWNQSTKLLSGISPFEQKPVHAKMISKLIFTNAGSILCSQLVIICDQGVFGTQLGHIGICGSDDAGVPCCVRLVRSELAADEYRRGNLKP